MKHKYYIILLAPLLLAACDNNSVPRVEYEAAIDRIAELEAENDDLHFQLQDLRLYSHHLEELLSADDTGNPAPVDTLSHSPSHRI